MRVRVAFLLIVGCLAVPTSLFGADLTKATAKYIAAAQKQDLKALFDMGLFTQQAIKKARAESPKFRVEKDVSEVFERNKSNLQYRMFTPSAKWRILETKRTKLQMFDGKYNNGHIVYVETVYPNIDDAPEYDFNGIESKPLRRGVFMIYFDDASGLWYSVETFRAEFAFWETPVHVSNLTYSYDNRSLNLRFDVDGGKPHTLGGTPPYTSKIFINGQPIAVFFGKYADTYIMQELDAGRWLELRYEGWPPETKFPLTLRLELSDSSQPPKTGAAEVSITNGRIMRKHEWNYEDDGAGS